MTIVIAAATNPETWLLAPGSAVDGGLGEAAVDDHPARQSRADVRAAEADQLTIGIDRIVMLGGVRLGGAQSLGEPDQHHPAPAAGELDEIVEADIRHPQRGQAASMWPTISTPWSSRLNTSTAMIPRITATSDPGTAGATRRRIRMSASDATPTSSVSPWV